MYIEEISLKNFRNYEYEKIVFEKGINLFYGENAQGKTNIIEAIYLSAIGKSFRAKQDKEMIKTENEKAEIQTKYRRQERSGKVEIALSDKKEIFLNEIKLKKVSELLGNINVVLFNPEDIEILKEGPSKRRRFLNILISQIRPKYVYVLNQYLKVLEQRNIYLRQIKIEGKEEKLLDIWDEKLIELGYQIYCYRKEFIEKIKEKIEKIHLNITQKQEKIEIIYFSDCYEIKEYKKTIKQNRKKDILKGYTTKGIHRDDFLIKINDKPIGIYGSQGQQRTAVLSLKLSELEIMYEEVGEYPILLLDDFMSELDKKRRKNVLENIKEAQVIITCTEKIEENYNIYNIEKGKIKK